jgi:hypothetical protein
MRKLNFHKLLFSARRWLGSRHGVVTSFSFGDERPGASVAVPGRQIRALWRCAGTGAGENLGVSRNLRA